MALPNVMNTGRTGMVAAKTAIATTGHNITNANTEGYSRQRVELANETPQNAVGSKAFVGQGVKVDRVSRINDEYVEKQLRNGLKDMSHYEERDLSLRQLEDIFNEMNGDGLNRVMSRFFNEFRKLSNDPDSEAVRQSVREATQAMINDFKRIRTEVEGVRKHIDNRIEGYAGEVNALTAEIKDLNVRIKSMELSGGSANDLRDQRDMALKKLGSYMDLSMHKDKDGAYIVDIRGVGPLVAGPSVEKFTVSRTPSNESGKPENALDIISGSSANSTVTHQIKGGRLGALVEVRDQTLSEVLSRLDELAFELSRAVNQVHEQGITRTGFQGVSYFKKLAGKERAAELIDLSDEIKANINNIATAAELEAPGDNRIAIAISGLQAVRGLNEGNSTFDDVFNSMVSTVGIATAQNRSALNQQKNIMTQLEKVRDQISGVSIDEETTNLLQYQHSFDASAKVIQVADQMLKTILDLR